MRGILDACSDPTVRKVVVQKSAQIGYTAGVVCNVLGYHAHYRPSVQVVMFPRLTSAKDFAAEKLDPMIRSTPALSSRISLRSRIAGNSQTRKHFPGGLMKLVGANSPSDIKSTSARIVVVEEPDDASQNVKGQGDAIKLVEERCKTYPDHLILEGGTPTAKGASSIEAEMVVSDQRYFYITCHDCNEEHIQTWDNITIPNDESGAERPKYGKKRWEEAYYSCPHCGSIWSEDQRLVNVSKGQWRATVDSTVRGFYCNELMSLFDESRVPILARKYLEAKFDMDNGDASSMIAFWNSTLGLPWEYRGELPEEDELRNRAEDYKEWCCPVGGFIVLMTVDVQHDRLAVTCWVVGRNEEMWLSFRGELPGKTIDPDAGAWLELNQLLPKKVRHANGHMLPISAVAIDCSDGQTSDAVYAYVRAKNGKNNQQVIAVKGAPDNEGRIEIWTAPKPIDPNNRSTKAQKYGVLVHTVGTAKAKDLILGWAEEGGRVRLLGSGPGRMHWYQSVRPDFYEQLLGEIKIPDRNNPKRRRWKERTDRRNEALDCTVYAIYLVRHLRLHLRSAAAWDLEEIRLMQASMFDETEESPPVVPVENNPPPAKSEHRQNPARPVHNQNSFASPEWMNRL